LKKFANLGIGGTGKYEETAWNGIFQKDIANILQENINCKRKIFESLEDKIIFNREIINNNDKETTDNKLLTVEECFIMSDINHKKVKVQGNVVKFSSSIMGKNWFHIQDGTGDPSKETHDLVITTSEEVSKGSVVLAEGILNKKKDFGAGYIYAAIIEDAKILSVR
jgi:hypothetical protein